MIAPFVVAGGTKKNISVYEAVTWRTKSTIEIDQEAPKEYISKKGRENLQTSVVINNP